MIVVTGATGNVGRPLVAALAAAGEQVVAVSRRPSDVPAGVRHRVADLAEPESLRPVVDAADAVFLLVSGEDLRPYDILDVAKTGGVRRIVLLSSQGAVTRPDISSYAAPRAFEKAVQESGLEWTILRPGGFDTNAFLWVEPIRSQRAVAAPFPETGLPFVDPADIAEVAAVVLRQENHAGQTYELTGPALVTARERVAAIGDALGEPVRFAEQSPADARAEMVRFMPESVVDGTLRILGQPTAAEQRVSPDIERILGRPPRSFAEWAARNIGAFA
jgi:uncharacterized protein YbjT (DUF2867 family)